MESFISPYTSPEKLSSSESTSMLVNGDLNRVDNDDAMLLSKNHDFPDIMNTEDSISEDVLSKGDFALAVDKLTQDENNRDSMDLNMKTEFQDNAEALLQDNHNAQGDIQSNLLQMSQSDDQISAFFSSNDNHTSPHNMENDHELRTYESATANAYFTANNNSTNHIPNQTIAQNNNIPAIPTAPTASLNSNLSNPSHLNNQDVHLDLNDEVFAPNKGQSTDDDTENRPPNNDYLQEMMSSANSEAYEPLPRLNLTINSPVHSSTNSPRSPRKQIHPSCRSRNPSGTNQDKEPVEHFLTINTDLSKFKDLTINVDFQEQDNEKRAEKNRKVYSSPKSGKHDLTFSVNLSTDCGVSLASSHDCNLATASSTGSLSCSTASAELDTESPEIQGYSDETPNIIDEDEGGNLLSKLSDNEAGSKNDSLLLSNVFLLDDDPFFNSEVSLSEDYFTKSDNCQMGDILMELKDQHYTSKRDELHQKISDEMLFQTDILNTGDNLRPQVFDYDDAQYLLDDVADSKEKSLDTFNFGCRNSTESCCEIDLVAPYKNIAYCTSYSDDATCDYLLNNKFLKSDESLILQSGIARDVFKHHSSIIQHDPSWPSINVVKCDDDSSPSQSVESNSSDSDTTVKPSTSNERRFLTQSYSSYSDSEILFRRSKDCNLNQEYHKSCINFGKEMLDFNNTPKTNDFSELCKSSDETYSSYAEIYSLNKKFQNNFVPSIELSSKSPIIPLHSTESASTVSTVKTADFSEVSDETTSSDSYSIDLSALSLTNNHPNSSDTSSDHVERNLKVELPFYDHSSRSSIDRDYCRYFADDLPSSSVHFQSSYQPSFTSSSCISESHDFEYSNKVGSSMKDLVSTCQSVVKVLDNVQKQTKARTHSSELDLDALKKLVAKNEDTYFGDTFQNRLNTTEISLEEDHNRLYKPLTNNFELSDNLTHSSLNSQLCSTSDSEFNSTVVNVPIASHDLQSFDTNKSEENEFIDIASQPSNGNIDCPSLPTDNTHFSPYNKDISSHHTSTIENTPCDTDQTDRITFEDVKNLPIFSPRNDLQSKKKEEKLLESFSDNKIAEYASRKFACDWLKREPKNTQSQNSFFQDPNSRFYLDKNLTSSEMMSMSQKMEKEFREMLIQEKKDARNQNGGTSSSEQLKVESKQQILQQRKTPLTSKADLNRTAKTSQVKPRRSIVPPKTLAHKKKLIPVTTLHLTSPVKSPTHKKFPSKLSATPKRVIPTHRTGSAPTLGTSRRVYTPTTIRRVAPNSPDTSPRPITSPRVKVEVKTPVAKNYKYQRPLSAASTTSIGSGKSHNSVNSAGTPNKQYRMPEHLKNVKSKTGSMNNINHTPSGGNVRIESKKANYQSVTSKCGSKDNQHYTPGGGNVKIENKRSSFTGVSAKCGSVANIHYKPGGGNVKIESKKLDFSHVASKCGSKDNIKHTPKGGNVKVETKRMNLDHVRAKCGSKDNQNHTPGGGKVKIESKKLNFDKVTSKCGSTDNIKHKPQGGNVKVESKKLDFSHIKPKCGSKDNQHHTPGGGKVKIESKKLNFDKVTSKCGSTDNIKHKPQGGNVKIFSESQSFNDVGSKIGSKDNIHHTPKGGNTTITNSSIDLSNIRPKVGSRDQIDHVSAGGNIKILNKGMDLSNVQSKCGSLDNTKHVAGGGDVMIFDEKLAFDQAAQSKVGSLDNAQHTPGGGNVAILNDKLNFRQSANARTDSGINMSSTSSES